MEDAPNARICVDRACAMLGSSATETSVVKRKKTSKKTKPRKKHKKSVNLLIVGTLPHCLSSAAFRAAVTPMLEDRITGEVQFVNFNRMNNRTYCYNFTGMCPVHSRVHKGSAKVWQLKQHTNHVWCGFKCWKQDSYIKLFSNPILCDF